MTSGGENGTNGSKRRSRLAALLAFAAVGLGFAVVNALSDLDERRRMGRPVDYWEPWVWELTSVASALLLAPLVFRLSQRLWPPQVRWRIALPMLAIFSVPFSMAHTGMMIGFRHAIYFAVGDTYRDAGPILEVLVYEFRKDLLTYIVLLLLPHLAERLIEHTVPAKGAAEFRLEVRDGNRTVWIAPADIDWAEAQGNYVELHGRFGSLLHRRTLVALEEELRSYGFVRIHRSRIVRSAAVTGVETKTSGDFEACLSSGEQLIGSRRFRTNLT